MSPQQKGGEYIVFGVDHKNNHDHENKVKVDL